MLSLIKKKYFKILLFVLILGTIFYVYSNVSVEQDMFDENILQKHDLRNKDISIVMNPPFNKLTECIRLYLRLFEQNDNIKNFAYCIA